MVVIVHHAEWFQKSAAWQTSPAILAVALEPAVPALLKSGC